ncbi:hypothetical protein RBB50_006460 [Rhinocladiella similis]
MSPGIDADIERGPGRDSEATFDDVVQDEGSLIKTSIVDLASRIRLLQEKRELDEEICDALKSLIFELPVELMMPTGPTWLEGPLWEEFSSKGTGEGGGLRRTNDLGKGDKSYINIDTDGFTVDATEILHINGFESGDTSSPMTLLVLNIQLHSTVPGFKFSWVVTRLSFDGEANPEVIAVAPFSSTTTWNVSREEHERIISMGLQVGANYVASAKVEGHGEWTVRKQQEYFALGNASPMVSNQRQNGVKWYLEANHRQSDQVAPQFRIAVLLKRAVGNKPFRGTLSLRPNGKQLALRRAFQYDARRARKNFEPKEVTSFTTAGELLLKQCNIKENKLGELAQGDSLTGLAYVWGLDPLQGGSATGPGARDE